ncbi:MAG: hypothetical protein GXC73_15800 [Chitinophagaceae bacterium]|nr:hypothetical protein [Chitinophagaceae bacterium]
MKYLFLLFLLVGLHSNSQPIKSGTYIFKYCDIEYNKCLSTCKIVVKGYSITVYATKELAKAITGTSTGDIIKKGILTKNKKGEWIIKDSKEKTPDTEDIHYLNFRKREFWRY